MNLNKALIIFKGDESYPRLTKVSQAFIDIWWVVHDGGLLLLLPYLLTMNKVWSHHTTIRVFACVTSDTENPEKLHAAVSDHLAAVRITATVTIINLAQTSIADHMRQVEYIPGEQEGNRSRSSSLNDIAIANTHNKTVGEVFSQQVYDVHYQVMGEMTVEGYGNQPIYTFATNENGEEENIPSVSLNINNEKNQNSDHHQTAASKFHTALTFNQLLLEYSAGSNLVVSNMPLLTLGDLDSSLREDDTEFMEYVDIICAGISNMLLIRGTGSEVITTYA